MWEDGAMPEDFGALVRPNLEAQLAPGEPLTGVCAAVHQKMFSGQMYAIGVTDLRLLFQPVGRHAQPKGEPLAVAHQHVESAQFDGAADGWWTAPMAILDARALTLKLRTRDGQALKLMMMKGGTGLMGSMGGGASQEQGVLALANWIRVHAASR